MGELAYEPVVDELAAGAAAGDVVDEQAESAEPETPVVADPTAEPAIPAWALEMRQAQEQTRHYVEQVAARLAPQPVDDTESLIQAYEDAQATGDVRTQLAITAELGRRQLAEAYAPIQSTLQSFEEHQAQTWADQQVSAAAGDLTDKSRDLLRVAALGVAGDQQRNQQLQNMVDRFKEIEQAAGVKAVAEYKKTLGNLSGAREEPGTSQTVAVEGAPPVTSMIEAGRRIAARVAAEQAAARSG